MCTINFYINQSPTTGACFFSVPCTPQTTIANIRNEIYYRLQVSENQYNIDIRGRYNDIVHGRYESLFFPVNSEDEWRLFYHQTFETRGLPIIEFYVDLIPVYGFSPEQNVPYEMHGGGGSSGGYGSGQPVSSVGDIPYETHGVDNSAMSPVQINEEPEDHVEVRDEGDEEGPYNYTDLSTGEEFTDEEDGEGAFDDTTEGPSYANFDKPYVSGRTTMQHPVSALSDISGFQTIGMSQTNVDREGELAPGRLFRSKKQLILAVCDYSCKKNVEVRTQASNKSRIIMVCVQRPKCMWRLYAITEGFNSNWKISTNPTNHTCSRPPGERLHDNLSSDLIAEHIRDELKKNLGLTVQMVGALIRARYTLIEPTYNKMWRGRERALEQLFGSWEGAYNKLPQLLEAIKMTTPGTEYSIISWETNDPNVRVFKMAAWAFGPCIQALKYARPVISIDASFLSGRYRGKLFTVCGYDPENRLIPVAFGLAEKEENISWGWFMSWVRFQVIGDCTIKYCVVSDRHKAIKNVFLSTEFGWKAQGPDKIAIHRYCMQHVAENLWKEAGGASHKQLKDIFKCRLANKKNPVRFREKWLELKESNRKAYEYLRNCGKFCERDPKERPKLYMWAQSEDKGHRWGIMTSNGSESLNSVFRVERRLPVTALVEGTFYKCANWMNVRTQEAIERLNLGERWQKKIHEKIHKHGTKAASMTTTVLRIDLGTFIVKGPGVYKDGQGYEYPKFQVEIPPGMQPTEPQLPFTGTTCSCQKPQLTGIPCAHVIAVCRKCNYDVDQFVDKRYSLVSQHNIWSAGQFHCYKDEDQWPVYHGPKIVPDKSLINRGRRKIVRTEMWMDRMERNKNKGPKTRKPTKKSGQSSTNQPSTSQPRHPQPPYPMDAMQFGRYSTIPPTTTYSPAREQIVQHIVQPTFQSTVQPARRSLHVDPRNMDRHENIGSVQPSRNSISIDPRSINVSYGSVRSESARFPTSQASTPSTSTQQKGKGIRSKFRNIFSRK